MFVRLSTSEVGPDALDASVRHLKDVILPKASDAPGWVGSTLLINRETGVLKTLAFWDSQEALEASDKLAERLRAEFSESAKPAKPVSFEVFEVALDLKRDE